MAREHFRSFENQPASRETIKRLYSLLETISERPPKDIDEDETFAMNEQFQDPEKMKGMISFYSIRGNEMREPQRMFIALAPKELHSVFEKTRFPIGRLSLIQHEDMGDHREWVQTKYNIYGDNVSKHRIFPEQTERSDETVGEKMVKQARKEKTDEKYGLTLMTEAEVMSLNAELGTLIEE